MADCFLLLRSVKVQTVRDIQDHHRIRLPLWELTSGLQFSLDSFLSKCDATEILFVL